MSDNAQKPPAFIFGARPVTVESDVKFKSVTGIDVDITCQFKYRDRKEFAELWDSLMGQKSTLVPERPEDFTFKALADRDIKGHAEQVLEYLTGWPLDLPMNKDSLEQMFTEEPKAAGAFWEAYRRVCIEGPAGN